MKSDDEEVKLDFAQLVEKEVKLEKVNVRDESYYDLEKFLNENSNFISEKDIAYVEKFVIEGIPNELRRKYWISVSGAKGYLEHYSDGYYLAISSEIEESYPDWPHPDY